MNDFIYTPSAVPLSVLDSDDHIVVADKPSGLLSVPGRGEDRSDCLISRLRELYPDILLVHRLDLDTSGVMIFGRTKDAQGFLGQQFEKRLTKKVYIARVWGEVAEDSGRVDLPLIVDWPNRPRQHPANLRQPHLGRAGGRVAVWAAFGRCGFRLRRVG